MKRTKPKRKVRIRRNPFTDGCGGFKDAYETMHCAARDLLALWDRRDESGWTAADVKRLEEIRKLVTSH